jgi:hypothetical protein
LQKTAGSGTLRVKELSRSSQTTTDDSLHLQDRINRFWKVSSTRQATCQQKLCILSKENRIQGFCSSTTPKWVPILLCDPASPRDSSYGTYMLSSDRNSCPLPLFIACQRKIRLSNTNSKCSPKRPDMYACLVEAIPDSRSRSRCARGRFWTVSNVFSLSTSQSVKLYSGSCQTIINSLLSNPVEDVCKPCQGIMGTACGPCGACAMR